MIFDSRYLHSQQLAPRTNATSSISARRSAKPISDACGDCFSIGVASASTTDAN